MYMHTHRPTPTPHHNEDTRSLSSSHTTPQGQEQTTATHVGEVWEEVVLWCADHVLDVVKALAVVVACVAHHDRGVHVHRVGGVLRSNALAEAKHDLQARHGTASGWRHTGKKMGVPCRNEPGMNMHAGHTGAISLQPVTMQGKLLLLLLLNSYLLLRIDSLWSAAATAVVCCLVDPLLLPRAGPCNSVQQLTCRRAMSHFEPSDTNTSSALTRPG